MHRLLVLSRRASDYHGFVEAARLPDLVITSTPDAADAAANGATYDLAFGEPALLRQVLPALTGVSWVQSTWAGVEPLLDPALRRDYILTNARGVFGVQMSEYVFAYLLAHERKIFEKQASQAAGRWDPEPPTRLRGKQLGLLGVGTIGAALARTAKHFGMRVKGYTRASEDSADVVRYFHGSLAAVGAAGTSSCARCRRAPSSSTLVAGAWWTRTRWPRRFRTGGSRAPSSTSSRPSRCRPITSSGGCPTCASPRTPPR
jgi:phosphoglycerate dehydrogenase-like enzyme